MRNILTPGQAVCFQLCYVQKLLKVLLNLGRSSGSADLSTQLLHRKYVCLLCCTKKFTY